MLHGWLGARPYIHLYYRQLCFVRRLSRLPTAAHNQCQTWVQISNRGACRNASPAASGGDTAPGGSGQGEDDESVVPANTGYDVAFSWKAVLIDDNLCKDHGYVMKRLRKSTHEYTQATVVPPSYPNNIKRRTLTMH